ncbi:MAG: hypothetical protein K6F92_03875 [Lachnospiraceae bacterium]|nr:hypothetical protein [Lachnospiraceae bacterium]
MKKSKLIKSVLLAAALSMSACSNIGQNANSTEETTVTVIEVQDPSQENYTGGDDQEISGTTGNETILQSAEENTTDEPVIAEETTLQEETTTVPAPTTPPMPPVASFPAYDDPRVLNESMTFINWFKADMDFIDGIYYGRYYNAFIPAVRIPVYSEMDTSSGKTYLETDDECYAIATDGCSWIKFETQNGKEGWAQVQFQSGTGEPPAAPEYSFITDGGLVPGYNAFIYDHDGDDGRNRSGVVDITENSALSSLVTDGDIWTKAFKDPDELKEFLTSHDAGDAVMGKYNDMKEKKETQAFSGDLQVYIMKLGGECRLLRYLGDSVNDREVLFAYTDDQNTEKYYIEITVNWLNQEEQIRVQNGESIDSACLDVLLVEVQTKQ